jgi:F-type H+-transporting ATPase subunit c
MILTRRNTLILNLFTLLLISMPIMANNNITEYTTNNYGITALAAALCLALTAIAGVLSQGMVATTALTGTARNPDASQKIFITMILSLALIESLVLFSLVMSMMILNKIP